MLRAIILHISFILITSLCAQNETVQFHHLGINEGITSTDINYLFQDSKAFIWYGSPKGLNRYDGYQSKLYVPKINYIDDVSVWFKIEDKWGYLWIGTYGKGLFRFKPLTILSGNNGYYLIGPTESDDGDVSMNKGAGDYWIVKIDTTGNLEWEKSYGGSGWDYPTSAVKTLNSGIVIVGESNSKDGDVSKNNGYNDYWIIKIDANGNLDWEKSYSGSMSDLARSISRTTDDGYIVSGLSFSSDGDASGNDGGVCWLTKLNRSGDLE